MATYDNKHWLLSNIRNSFISTDDTGMCEIVMAGENFPKLFYTKAMEEKSRMRDISPSKSREVGMTEIPEDGLQREIVTEYDPYPDMEDSEEEDFPEDSYIRNNDMPHRSNTTQWRDKKEQAMRKAAKIKVIKWETPSRELTDEERSELFTRKELKSKPNKEKKKSLLADQLEKCPHLPHRQYLEYAKFDGTAQTRLNIKTFKIFMTILSEEHQNYPVIVCIIGSAKIIDLIGFTCYKYSIEHPEITLGSVHSYGLCIAEDDGEVDFELPYLDANEPCSKFNFSCLGLVDLKSRSLQPAAGSIPDHSGASALFGMLMYPKPGESGNQNMSRQNTGDSGTSEAVANAIQAVSEDKKGTNGDTEQSIIMAASVPHYKAYKVQQLHKLLPNTPVRLVVSLDSIEVEPQPQSGTTKLLSRARFFAHSVDTVAWCQVTEAKSQRSTFRLVYSRAGALDRHPDFFSPSSTYKHHDFECDHETAKEIVDKINRILDLRNSPCRREYKSAKDRKQQTRRSFQNPRHVNYS